MRLPAHADLHAPGLTWAPLDAAARAWLEPLTGRAGTIECAYASGAHGGRPAFVRMSRTGEACPRTFVKLVSAAQAARETEAAELSASLRAMGVACPVLREVIALADGCTAFCYDWIEGRPPDGSVTDMAGLGRALAGLHGALQRAQAPFGIARRTRDRLAAFEGLAVAPHFGARWRHHGDLRFVSRMRDAFLEACDAMLVDALPNHGDLNRGNVLVCGDARVAFLDLEDALHMAVWPGFDLAKIVERMVLPMASNAASAQQAIASLVKAYTDSEKRAFDAAACPGTGRLAAAMRWHMGLAVLVLTANPALPLDVVERELAKFKAVDARIGAYRELL